jgi:hypothetical protein
MITKNSFSYYLRESMLNGIIIDMDRDILHTDRRIYLASDLAVSVGGFSSAVKLAILIMLPFLKNSELDSYLISSLYK